MSKKQIISFVTAFFLALIFYFTTKNFLDKHFTLIEKNQEQILKVLEKINVVAQVRPTESPFSNTENLGKLKEDLAKLKNKVEDQNEILGLNIFESTMAATPTTLPLSFATISDKRWQSVDVFQDKSSTSKIIGQAVYGKTYPLLTKETGYYYIQLNDSTFGWVLSQFMREY